MRSKFALCLAILMTFLVFDTAFVAKSQVPNPKFTQKLVPGCPVTTPWGALDFLSSSAYNIRVQDWWNPTLTSPDYFHGCNPDAFYSVPARKNNSVIYPDDANAPNPTNQKAFSGISICDFNQLMNTDSREYITVRLQSDLLVGQTYTITFKLRSSENLQKLKEIGVLLTTNQVTSANAANSGRGYINPSIGDFGVDNTPPVYTYWDEYDWRLVSIPITITGTNKRYLTIGDFRPNVPSSGWVPPPNDPIESNCAYYFIDDVEVISTPGCCDFNVFVERDKTNTTQQCCYNITFETGSDVCPINYFEIKDPSNPLVTLGSGNIAGGMQDNQIVTVNTCITSTSVAELRIDFYAGGSIVCSKFARFMCECSCADNPDYMQLKLQRVTSTSGSCCFKLNADNVGVCDFSGYKVLIPSIPGATFTPASGVTTTTSGGMIHINNGGTFAGQTNYELGTICIPAGTTNYPFMIRLVKISTNQICVQRTIPLSCKDIECCDAIEVTERIATEDDILKGKSCCISLYDPATNSVKVCCSPIVEINLIPTPNCPVVYSIAMYKDGVLVNGIGRDGSYGKFDWPLTPCPTSSSVTYELKFYDENNNLLCTKSFTIPGCSIVGKMGNIDPQIKNESQSFVLSVNPNPTTHQLTLQVDNLQTSQSASVDIYDLSGNKLINVYNGNVKSGINSFTVNVTSLPTGQYMIKVKSDIVTQSIQFIKR